MMRVALICPPFGPLGVPSLGLGLLAAGLKARGIPCRTFYWMFRMLADLPGASPSDRGASYRLLASGAAWPFNEWAFRDCLFAAETHPAAALTEAARRLRGLPFDVQAAAHRMRQRAP